MHVTKDNWQVLFKGRPTVRMNGGELRGVVEADDEAGYVIVYERDAAGKYKIADDGKSAVETRLEGRVEIIGERRAV